MVKRIFIYGSRKPIVFLVLMVLIFTFGTWATSPGAEITYIGGEVVKNQEGKPLETRQPVWLADKWWGGKADNGYLIKFTSTGIKIGKGLVWDRIDLGENYYNDALVKFENKDPQQKLENFFWFDGIKTQIEYKGNNVAGLYHKIKDKSPNPSDDYLLPGATRYTFSNDGKKKELKLGKDLSIYKDAKGDWAFKALGESRLTGKVIKIEVKNNLLFVEGPSETEGSFKIYEKTKYKNVKNLKSIRVGDKVTVEYCLIIYCPPKKAELFLEAIEVLSTR